MSYDLRALFESTKVDEAPAPRLTVDDLQKQMGSNAWPECFRTGIVPADEAPGMMCAHGLLAWGHVAMGMLPTRHFDQVMNVLAKRLGIECGPDAFLAESERMDKLAAG